MIPLTITLDGDGAFADLQGQNYQRGDVRQLAVLQDGTVSGLPSIALRIVGDDGSVIVAETTWRLLYSACRAVEARYGEPL